LRFGDLGGSFNDSTPYSWRVLKKSDVNSGSRS
jgi:hypothetical protein